MTFSSRSFNHVVYDRGRNSVIKTSRNADKLINEIVWYRALPESLQEYLPKLIRYSTERENPFLEYQYCPYEPLSKQFLDGCHSCERWLSITNTLLDVLHRFKRYTKPFPEALRQKYLYHMVVEKTRLRLGQLRELALFHPLFVHRFEVNGIVCGPLDRYIKLLSPIFHRLFGREPPVFSIIHGDFCFSNILFDPVENRLKLIDPRGEFGSASLYGDIRYDLAKLRHSVNGLYDFIVADRFTLKSEHAVFNYHVDSRQGLVSSGFDVQLCDRGCDLMEIAFLEAVLFLSMVPLHGERTDRQLIMLCHGAHQFEEILHTLENRQTLSTGRGYD